MWSQQLPIHASNNKLRDVEQKYETNGHIFSFNREILLTFDVCGPCEAHAIMLAVTDYENKHPSNGSSNNSIVSANLSGLLEVINTAPTLAIIDKTSPNLRINNVNFAKCPVTSANNNDMQS